MIEVGQLINGKYRCVRLLGDGGMGSVYEATHEGLGTRVAIKVLHADLARRSGLVERFLREARVSAQIRSPHVVQVTDVDRTERGEAFIVMELLQGEPLSGLLGRTGRVSISIACDYTIQILEALEAAHALGVTHRDLKPENVFITFVAGKPVLKLIDFGIAKAHLSEPGAKNLTVAGVVMGTAEYMAPEQAYSADKVDARSDLYAVGVMLYEMIAGARPVHGDDARIIALKVERGEVQPLVHAVPDVPRELAGLVHRAMAARPELRFASATEMRLALEATTGRATGAATGGKSVTAQVVQTAPHRATGTVMGAPAYAMPPMQGAPVRTSPGGGPMTQQPPYASAGVTPGPQAYATAKPIRRRKSATWLLVALPVLAGAGIVIAFAVNAANSSPDPAPTPASTPALTATKTATASATATPSPTAAETVAPLVTSTVHPRPHPSPTPTASGSSGPTPPPLPTTPSTPSLPTAFPTAFPSSFPMPFPTTNGSGVGPVIPIPSAFPFAIPGMPTASSPAPPPTSAP